MQRVITNLIPWYEGSPILVIGGGPSVTKDLPSLPPDFHPALVLSANEHGTKQTRFAVDYIVNCDKMHCIRHVPMEPWLRQFGVPIINKWSWADVRLTDWNFNGNSGTTAVAIAAALGGSPIVVTGIDLYAMGRSYFYDTTEGLTPAKKRMAAKPILTQPDRRLRPLGDFVGKAHIRPMSGVMTTRWPKYMPGEVLGAPPVLPYTARAIRSAPYRALKRFPFGNFDFLDVGSVIMLTESEAAPFLREGRIAKT